MYKHKTNTHKIVSNYQLTDTNINNSLATITYWHIGFYSYKKPTNSVLQTTTQFCYVICITSMTFNYRGNAVKHVLVIVIQNTTKMNATCKKLKLAIYFVVVCRCQLIIHNNEFRISRT